MTEVADNLRLVRTLILLASQPFDIDGIIFEVINYAFGTFLIQKGWQTLQEQSQCH